MRPGITARRDYDAARLRGLARTTKSAAQGRRLLALAEIYDGGSRSKAACVGGVGLQTIRDWVLRFNADGPEGLADRQAPGHPGKLNTAQREALAAMVESGPIPAIHGVVRWRLKDLALWVWEEFRASVSETTLSRTCARSAIASSRPALATMPRPRERSTLLKSVSRAPGRDRARQGHRSRPHRGLVR